jgi:hypothetical protein
MKSIIYTNNASLTVNGITYEKGQSYNVTDEVFSYLSQDFSAWFVVGRPMDVVEPIVEPIVEPAKEAVKPPKK